MTGPPYLDTSALAKWYLNEPGSEEFAVFIAQQRSAVISRLAAIELRCLLARRRRARELTRPMERRVIAAFENDVRQGFLDVRPLDDRHAGSAIDLLRRLPAHPLRTLDAMHLAQALDFGATAIATADRVMAEAAQRLGFDVARFDRAPVARRG